jgi:hypothetical protein
MSSKKISIEFTIDEIQEVLFTIKATTRRIDWVLDNNPPRKSGEADKMDKRARLLTRTATFIEKKLNAKALSDQSDNVVNIGEKK